MLFLFGKLQYCGWAIGFQAVNLACVHPCKNHNMRNDGCTTNVAGHWQGLKHTKCHIYCPQVAWWKDQYHFKPLWALFAFSFISQVAKNAHINSNIFQYGSKIIVLIMFDVVRHADVAYVNGDKQGLNPHKKTRPKCFSKVQHWQAPYSCNMRL